MYLDILLPPAEPYSPKSVDFRSTCTLFISFPSTANFSTTSNILNFFFFFFWPYTSAINMSPCCCCESRRSPLLIWCVSPGSAVTELQRDKGASHSSQAASRGAAAAGSGGRGVGDGLLSKFPGPHMTEDRKLHYSGPERHSRDSASSEPRGRASSLQKLPQSFHHCSAESIPTYRIMAWQGNCSAAGRAALPRVINTGKKGIALPLSAHLLQTKTHT